ncbi:MAG: hypothetical protein V2B19_07235 [Pseudomonadota bacterium]
MHSLTKQLVVLLCALAIALLPVTSSSFAASENMKDDFTTEKMAVDLVAIRPLGIVSTIFGFTLYVFSLPFSIPGGNVAEVWESTVVKPAQFTFDRPLGDF